MFTARQIKIIEMIAGNVSGIYNTRIASALHVSSRTIRNEVRMINAIWGNQAKIVSSNQIGYYFTDEDLPFVRDFLYRQRSSLAFEDEEDRRYSLLGLLIYYEESNVYDLADQLYVSSQSIMKDLQVLKEDLLTNYQLDPITVSKDEVRFALEEEKLRKLMFRIMKNEVLAKGSKKPFCLRELLREAFDQSEFTWLTKQVDAFFHQRQVRVNDDSLIMISSALYIVHTRNEANCVITRQEPYAHDELWEALYTQMKQAGICLMEFDKALLYDFLHTFQLGESDQHSEELSSFCISLFEEFCNEVLEKYNFDLRSSKELYDNMLVHTEYMLRRLKGSFELRNPIITDVKKNYPFAYEISMLLVPIVYKYTGRYIQDDELSYIAIYLEHFMENINERLSVALVASARRSVMNIVNDRLSQCFSNLLEIHEVYSQSELERYAKTHKVDFVLTLSEGIAHPQLPVYCIANFLDENDQRQINAIIRRRKLNRRFFALLDRYFSEESVFLYEKETTFEQVMRNVCDHLHQSDLIDDADLFYEDLLLREVNYPTTLNERMMIPHPLSAFSKRTAVSVAILKTPIKAHHQSVEIIFTLAIERKLNEDVNVLFDFIKQLAARREAMDALVAVKTPRELLDVLKQLSKTI